MEGKNYLSSPITSRNVLVASLITKASMASILMHKLTGLFRKEVLTNRTTSLGPVSLATSRLLITALYVPVIIACVTLTTLLLERHAKHLRMVGELVSGEIETTHRGLCLKLIVSDQDAAQIHIGDPAVVRYAPFFGTSSGALAASVIEISPSLYRARRQLHKGADSPLYEIYIGLDRLSRHEGDQISALHLNVGDKVVADIRLVGDESLFNWIFHAGNTKVTW